MSDSSPQRDTDGRSVPGDAALCKREAGNDPTTSEVWMKALFEGLEEAVFIVTPDRLVRDFNPAAERMFGFTKDEVVGRSTEMLHVSHDHYVEFGKRISEAFELGQSAFIEYEMKRKSGEIFPSEHTVTLSKSSSGDPIGIISIVRDLADRKKAEYALAQSEERFRLAMEASNDGLWDWNMTTDDVYRSPGFFSMLGYEEDEFPHGFQGWESLVHPDDRESTMKALKEYLAGKRQAYEVEFRMFHKSGDLVWILSRGKIVAEDENGKPIRMVGTHSNISGHKKTEEALRKSESFLNNVIDHSPSPMYISDDRGTLIRTNKALLDLMCASEDELVGKYNIFQDNIVNEQGFLPLFEGVFERGETARFEITYDSSKLEGIDLERCASVILDITAFPILDSNGKTTNVVLQHIDITERKKAESAIRRQRDFLQQLIDAIPTPLFYKDTDGRYMGCNIAYESDTGLSRAEIIGKTPFDVAPQELARVYHEQDLALLHDPGVQHGEIHRQDAAGTMRYVMFTKAPFWDLEGNVAGMVGVIFDITERKLAEDALKESERRLSTLMANLPGMACRCLNCPNWTMEFISEGCGELTGYSPDDFVDDKTISLGELIHPEDRQKVWDEVQGALAAGRPFELEYRICTRSGDEKWVWERTIGVPSESGDEIRLEGFISDITERKRLQEQLREAQKMEAVGTLAGGVAHDFSNLLQIIGGHAELLETELAHKGMKFSELDAILQSAHRGADLIQQILTFSRTVYTKFESIDLNKEVEDTARLLYRTIPKMIEIELKLEETLKPIRADSTQIEQIIINLAINATDAMPEGGTLTIETRNADLDDEHCNLHAGLEPGEHILLEVSDTGHGMEQDTLQHIFEPFFTTKEIGEGTGLGLATVFGIVKMHGGHILCESESDKGTTFSIYFPATKSVSADGVAKRETSSLAGGTETILVVDDEPLIADMAKKVLNKAGYSVITASSGNEAVSIYCGERDRIKLVVLDLIMPEMGGKQCLTELLEIDPGAKVLIASGFAVKGDTKQFLDSRAKGIVSKPFNSQELLRSVRGVLDAP